MAANAMPSASALNLRLLIIPKKAPLWIANETGAHNDGSAPVLSRCL
jgi:hypothetical protein